MKLALRKTPASNAPWNAKLASWAIKVRLVSQYSHGGLVIGDTLYHSTTHGLHCEPYSPEHWELFDLGDSLDESTLAEFKRRDGTGYDWFSLLAFVLPGKISDKRRLYCFEWCWLGMTGISPTYRVTPEMLLRQAIKLREA